MPRPRNHTPTRNKLFPMPVDLQARIDNCIRHGALGSRPRPPRSGQFTGLVTRLLSEWCGAQERALGIKPPSVQEHADEPIPSEEEL